MSCFEDFCGTDCGVNILPRYRVVNGYRRQLEKRTNGGVKSNFGRTNTLELLCRKHRSFYIGFMPQKSE